MGRFLEAFETSLVKERRIGNFRRPAHGLVIYSVRSLKSSQSRQLLWSFSSLSFDARVHLRHMACRGFWRWAHTLLLLPG